MQVNPSRLSLSSITGFCSGRGRLWGSTPHRKRACRQGFRRKIFVCCHHAYWYGAYTQSYHLLCGWQHWIQQIPWLYTDLPPHPSSEWWTVQGTQSFCHHSRRWTWQKIQGMAVWAEWFDLENPASTGHQFLHQGGFHLWRISAFNESQRIWNQRGNFWRRCY